MVLMVMTPVVVTSRVLALTPGSLHVRHPRRPSELGTNMRWITGKGGGMTPEGCPNFTAWDDKSKSWKE